jgi:hypothetical protein
VKITPSQRRSLLIAIALALAAAVIFDNEVEPRGAVSAAPAPAPAPAPRAVPAEAKGRQAPLPEIAIDKLDQKIPRDAVADALEPRSWEPPPAPRKELPPPAPQAPPLPFAYMGKIMEGGEVVVFLTKQDRNYLVKQGETIDGTYRVDDIKGTTMVLTYLPLNQQQILAIGAAN